MSAFVDLFGVGKEGKERDNGTSSVWCRETRVQVDGVTFVSGEAPNRLTFWQNKH